MLNHPRLTEQRIRNFLKEGLRRYYGAVVPLKSEFMPDREPLPFNELPWRTWRPIEVGTRWGGNWESAWFRFTGTVPGEWAGQEVWAVIDTGSEACVFDVTGNPVCGLTSGDDVTRKALLRVVRKARGGEPVELFVEAAANQLFGYVADCRLKEASLVSFRRDYWDLYYDFYFLNGLMLALPEDHPRRGRIRYALNQALNRYGDGTTAGIVAARAVLAGPLQRPANASALKVSAVGHAHIDVAWLWPLRETIRKCGRTFSTALRYMEDYPDYRFGASQAQLYAFVKERYPQLYLRIKVAVRAGRWEVQGGMWVEADCNIPSGESLVRQILHGKRFFQQEFGVEVDNLWLPDVFGYSAALPQIMKLAGIRHFTTQKLSWNQFDKFPHHTFLWEGIDGTRVFTHFPPSDTYCGDFEPAQLLASCRNFAEKDRADRWLYLFGHGDGGGGPSRHQLELARRSRDCEELPRVTQEFASEFFARAEAEIEDIPVWQGELYFELHRGTLTTQARNKRANRQAEVLLHDAEFLGSLARTDYPRAEFDRIWKLVLLNQFHDIIPGSSINWVYQDSARHYAEILEFARGRIRQSGEAWAARVDTRGPGRPWVVVNTLGWDRTGLVEMRLAECGLRNGSAPEGDDRERTRKDANGDAQDCGVRGPLCVTDDAGRELPSQVVEGRILVQAEVPALGHRVLHVVPGGAAGTNALKVSERLLENELLLVEFDEAGRVARIYDKVARREVIPPGEHGNALALYEDLPAAWDAWDVDVFYEEKAPEPTRLVSATVTEYGPVRAALRHERRVGEKSRLSQEIRLCAGSRMLEFVTRVDWHEEHRMLRVSFPTTVRAEQATYEIQFGHVTRPTHRNTSWDMARFEVAAQRWADLSDPGYGVALLNDCKYGHKVLRNVLDLNLLRSSKYPDPQADQGEHEFTYALLPHVGGFREAGVIRDSHGLNAPLIPFPAEVHEGDLPPVLSWFTLTPASGVVIDTVRPAEDDDTTILRLYESFGQPARCRLVARQAPTHVFRTDLLERNQEELHITDGGVDLEFRPFEIVTLRLA